LWTCVALCAVIIVLKVPWPAGWATRRTNQPPDPFGENDVVRRLRAAEAQQARPTTRPKDFVAILVELSALRLDGFRPTERALRALVGGPDVEIPVATGKWLIYYYNEPAATQPWAALADVSLDQRVDSIGFNQADALIELNYPATTRSSTSQSATTQPPR
jgi:hypothetical protein